MNASLIEALGWTLLHSLWQGCAVALLLRAALHLLRRQSAGARYAACCFAMLAVFFAAGVTLVRSWPDKSNSPERTSSFPAETPDGAGAGRSNRSDWSNIFPGRPERAGHEASDVPGDSAIVVRAEAFPDVTSPEPIQAEPKLAHLTRVTASLRQMLPVVVAVWAAGVLWGLLRLGAGWVVLRRQIAGAVPLEGSEWVERTRRLREALRISAPVRVLQSAAAAVPVAAGWLRPVILLPAGICSGLTIPQMEAILAHELAHIRRHDYAVNLLQCLADTLFFYHPAVRWISSALRREREYCCDDAAAALCGGPLPYAGALARLEECRGDLLPAPAATGHSLLDRVRRLLGVPAPRPAFSVLPWFAALAAMLLLAVAPVGLLRAGAGSEPGGPAENAKVAESAGPGGSAVEKKAKTNANADAKGEAAAEHAGEMADGQTSEPEDGEFQISAEDESGQQIARFFCEMTLFRPRRGNQDAGAGMMAESITFSHPSTEGKVTAVAGMHDTRATFLLSADGYLPVKQEWRAGQSTRLHARLKKAPIETVNVILPDGSPAAGARVLLGQRYIQLFLNSSGQLMQGDKVLTDDVHGWMGGRLMGEGLERIARCDAAGRVDFPLPGGDDVMISVIHDQGVITGAPLTEILSARKPLQLLRWASLSLDCGRGANVLLADARVSSPALTWNGRTRVDAEGKVHWPRVMPGTLNWYVEYRTQPDENGRARRSAALAGKEIASGEQVSVTARPQIFTGTLTGREDWSGVTILTAPGAPDADGSFRFTTMHDPGPVVPGKDGRFTTEPLFYCTGREKFELRVMVSGNPKSVLDRVLPSPSIAEGQTTAAAKTIDIGECKVGPAPPDWLPSDRPDVEYRFRAFDAESGQALASVQLRTSWAHSTEGIKAQDGVCTVRWQPDCSVGTPDHEWTSLEAGKAGKIKEIKLKRLPRVRGKLIDHAGKPAGGAGVYAADDPVTVFRLGEFDGDAWHGWQSKTTPDGSFDAPLRDARQLIFKTETLRFWQRTVDPGDGVEIRLPEPGSVEVLLPADGTGSEVTMTFVPSRWAGAQLTASLPATGETVRIDKLPPGKYRFGRTRTVGTMRGIWGMMVNQYAHREVTVEAGRRQMLDLRVADGVAIHGRVVTGVDAAPVVVRVVRAGGKQGREETADIRVCDAAGTFVTDPLPGGRWKITASRNDELLGVMTGQFLSDTQTITVQPGVDLPPLEFHLKPPAEQEPDAEEDEAFNEALARRLKRDGVWQVEKPCRECLAAAAKPNSEPPDQDEPFRKKLEAILKDAARVRPGMPRRELQTILAEEGGLSSVTDRQFPHRASPYIKVRVTFAPAAEGAGKEHPDDKVLTVSEPFFQWSIMD